MKYYAVTITGKRGQNQQVKLVKSPRDDSVEALALDGLERDYKVLEWHQITNMDQMFNLASMYLRLSNEYYDRISC